MKNLCGICGISWDDKRLIQNMTDILQHRGPDQQGTLNNSYVSLGSRRLSILDLSEKGRQPIHNEDESVFVVQNGEIYNFREVRKILENEGHSFYSDTDTEVIVHSYEQWGQKCVNKFNGMFAFAIWDSTKKEL